MGRGFTAAEGSKEERSSNKESRSKSIGGGGFGGFVN